MRDKGNINPINTVEFSRFIHLLYVPTLYCNLHCDYCYLHDQTKLKTESSEKISSTLEIAIKKFKQEHILPFNISLHGGEVTTLGNGQLEKLFLLIQNHYLSHNDILVSQGFRKSSPHIKTNLYSLDTHFDLLKKYRVSISGSLDIPLNLHEKYRLTKNGKSSLVKICSNIKKLSSYPYKKKISATLFSEHVANPERFIQDIWYINNELNFDMNNFNIMFGFCTQNSNETLVQANDKIQSEFYNILKEEFLGTELEFGFKNNWFDEFTPNFCTNSLNCGDKFFLLQSTGDIYSCVRGQGNPDFHYGNIYNDSIETILNNATNNIRVQHQYSGFNDECEKCGYLNICNTGCPFVKKVNNSNKSYTCRLQQTIYKDNPLQFPEINVPEIVELVKTNYITNVHPNRLIENNHNEQLNSLITEELYLKKNDLLQLIESDEILKVLYSDTKVKLKFDGELIDLKPQILKTSREIFTLSKDCDLQLLINEELFFTNSVEMVRNTLYLSMLRNNHVVYGDEKRLKQEHIFDYQLYYSQLNKINFEEQQFVEFDLSHFLNSSKQYFKGGVINNLFITTLNLRNYHYEKQKKNAFYHIQAINLPFQNLEFYWHNI